MAIAITLKDYLYQFDIDYETLRHPHSSNSMETARMAHVPGDQLAKSVLLRDANGFVEAVIPASHYVQMEQLHSRTDRGLGLASEQEIQQRFPDCETGAIPPIGDAYGCDVYLDDKLAQCNDVYFESGDHETLIHMSGKEFRKIMHAAQHGQISRHI